MEVRLLGSDGQSLPGTYADAATARIIGAAEDRAAEAAGYAASSIVPSAAIVLASCAAVVTRLADEAYPLTRVTPRHLRGYRYQDGYREGGKADIGGASLAPQASGRSPLS